MKKIFSLVIFFALTTIFMTTHCDKKLILAMERLDIDAVKKLLENEHPLTIERKTEILKLAHKNTKFYRSKSKSLFSSNVDMMRFFGGFFGTYLGSAISIGSAWGAFLHRLASSPYDSDTPHGFSPRKISRILTVVSVIAGAVSAVSCWQMRKGWGLESALNRLDKAVYIENIVKNLPISDDAVGEQSSLVQLADNAKSKIAGSKDAKEISSEDTDDMNSNID